MKIILMLLSIMLILSACTGNIRRPYFWEGIVIKLGTNDEILSIQNNKDVNNYLKFDSNQKMRIKCFEIDFDSNQVVTDYLFEFPNVARIIFFKCNGFNLSQNNKSVKSIEMKFTENVIQNLHLLENVGLVYYHFNHDNSINAGNFTGFRKMKHLKCLELDLQENTVLDNYIASLDSLEYLRINYASFEEIPKSISKLPNLIELSIHTDYEVTIPKCILKMKTLKIINFAGNRAYVENFNKKYKNKYPNLEIKADMNLPDLDKKYDYLKVKLN